MIMQLSTSLYQTCKLKKKKKKVGVRVGHENHTIPRWPLIPRQCYKYHCGRMSVVTLRQVQQEGVCRETQGLGLQVLHMHVRGERGVIHDREPLIPVVSNRVPSALRHRSKLHICQVPLCGDDEQVAEEVEVDVSERHSAAGLHTQLPHRTLTHQETAPDNQRNCLDGEGWSELVVAVTESNLFGQKDCSHLNSAKINQSVQADQLLDLFHSPHPTVAADHYLSESVTVSHSAPRRRRLLLPAGKLPHGWPLWLLQDSQWCQIQAQSVSGYSGMKLKCCYFSGGVILVVFHQ